MRQQTAVVARPFVVAKKSPRLTKSQNERVRTIARRVLVERYEGHATAMAGEIGVSQPTLSRFVSGQLGTTQDVALRVLELAGVSASEAGLSTDAVPRPHTLGSLPTWTTVEALAREIYRHVPEHAWVGARRFAAGAPLPHLTPEVILHLALAVAAADRQAS